MCNRENGREIAVYTVTKMKMREYFITKSDLWYHVFREKTENDLKTVEWLQKDTYTLNRNFARVFYHLDDAKGALVIARRRNFNWKDEVIYEEKPKEIKTTWSSC